MGNTIDLNRKKLFENNKTNFHLKFQTCDVTSKNNKKDMIKALLHFNTKYNHTTKT